jgi:hypothetical protein
MLQDEIAIEGFRENSLVGFIMYSLFKLRHSKPEVD